MYVGPSDYDDIPATITLPGTNNSRTTAELRITIKDEGILERDEYFGIELNSVETNIEIANSTSVIILNDDGELGSDSQDVNLYEYSYQQFLPR